MKRPGALLVLVGLFYFSAAQDAAAQSLLDRLGGFLPQADDDSPVPATPTSPRAGTARAAVSGPGYLGLLGDETDEVEGVLVVDVEVESPAARAGFQPGDRITSINGTAIKGMADMARLLQRRKSGDNVRFVVVRDDGEKELVATLAAGRPTTEDPPEDIPADDDPQPDERRAVLGIAAAPISQQLRDQYGFTVEEGAVIAAIEPGTPAHRQRLPIGGVIVDVNGQAIKAPEDLQEIIASSDAGDELELVYYIGKQRYRTKLRLAPPGEPGVAEARPRPGAANQRGSELERRLGDDGRRPILGRIGRVLDDIDEFAGEEPPENPEPEPGPTRAANAEEEFETGEDDQMLREEIELLRREISLLRRRVEELEQKLNE